MLWLTKLMTAILGAMALRTTQAQTIVDLAVGNDDFSTLVELLSAAGLVEALEGDGPFTVFAPTNDAFAAVDDTMLEAVAADTDLLTSVLL